MNKLSKQFHIVEDYVSPNKLIAIGDMYFTLKQGTTSYKVIYNQIILLDCKTEDELIMGLHKLKKDIKQYRLIEYLNHRQPILKGRSYNILSKTNEDYQLMEKTLC